jgi:hypothetical protein
VRALWLLAATLLAGLLLVRFLARRPGARRAEQAVLLHLRLGPGDDAAVRERLAALEAALDRAVVAPGLAEREEAVVDGERCLILLYGADAWRLFDALEGVLAAHPPGAGSHAVLRRGGPGAPEERIELSPGSSRATPPGPR